MRHYQLEVELRAAEGALARVLDLLERRAFCMERMVAEPGVAGQMRLMIDARGDSRPETLEAQLLRLADCVGARCRPAARN